MGLFLLAIRDCIRPTQTGLCFEKGGGPQRERRRREDECGCLQDTAVYLHALGCA